MDYRDNRQRWAESHQVVHFYAGQWCTFTPALTVKKRLDLDASLYTLLQILSVTLFEKMPIHQALAGDENRCNASQITNQLILFDF